MICHLPWKLKMYEEREGIVLNLKTENGYAVESIALKENALFLYHIFLQRVGHFYTLTFATIQKFCHFQEKSLRHSVCLFGAKSVYNGH